MEKGKDKRKDPTLILPGARTIICTATNYYTPPDTATIMPAGRVSRYAWGKDYHAVIKKRQKEFVRWFQKEFPRDLIKAYVDTGPLLEKVWAQQAGLGWQGKHSNLITRDYGSWVFLAEFITTLLLEPDEPAADLCGSCTACIDACPTQAIVEPYVVDARKCISYLTIEEAPSLIVSVDHSFHRSDHVYDHNYVNNWIYGCDICQDVCPWNRFQQETGEPAFKPRSEYQALTRKKIAAMTETEFQDTFKGSAMRRAKLAGWKRNVGKSLTPLYR